MPATLTPPGLADFTLRLLKLESVPFSEAVIARGALPNEVHIRSCLRGRFAGGAIGPSPSG